MSTTAEMFEDEEQVSPLVAGVSQRLKEFIQDNEILPGKGLPSERQLATEFEVSRGIVRGAIRRLIADGILEAKPKCKPVVRASLVQKSTSRRHVGIWLWPNTADYAAASILKGIQRSELGTEVRLIIASAPSGDWESVLAAERRFLESVAEDPEEACAIVWYLGGERNLSALQRLRSAQVPIVFVDRLPPEEFAGDFVGTDNEAGAEQAIQHLMDLGHRRIGLITNVDAVSSVRERELGYHRALRKAGVTPAPFWIQRIEDESVGIRNGIDNLLTQKESPTAIFCVNDHLALRTQEELERRGIRVPDEVSIVGFDGLLRWLPGSGNLTTLCQNFERIGQLAASLAVRRLGTESLEVFRHYLLDAPLIVRGSSGPTKEPG